MYESMNGLLTDLYELTMAAGYFECGKAAEKATFELDRKSVVYGVTGVQTCALPISVREYVRINERPSHRPLRTHHGRRLLRVWQGGREGHLRIRSEERRVRSDWSSDVCSSDLRKGVCTNQ